MEKTKTLNNLKNIFIQSYKWRNTNLSENESPIKFNLLSSFNIYLIIISIIIVIFSKKIGEPVLNSILTFTSIFATLIIPVLIMVYEKFSNNPNKYLTEVQQKSSYAKTRIKIHRNFTNRFIFTTLENVFIAITLISIIILYNALLIDCLKLSISDYSIEKNITLGGILISVKILIVLLAKSFFVFLLIKFIWFLFYSIGALGDFFKNGLNENE